MTKRATCPKCGRPDAVDGTGFGQGKTVICPDCGQQPPPRDERDNDGR